MVSVQEDITSKNPVLTAQALHNALPKMGMITRAIHADDPSSPPRATEPPMQVKVNHRYHRDPEPHFGTVLRNILGGAAVVTYSSGPGYLGTLNVQVRLHRRGLPRRSRNIKLQHRVTGVEKLTLDDLDQPGPGSLLHIETPLSPTGESLNLEYHVAKVHQAGAYISIDATFASPPMQDPLQFGVDIAMHSGTKYIGVHSNRLFGVLVAHQDRKE